MTFSMLLILNPHTFILNPNRPMIHSFTVYFVIFELTFVNSALRWRQHTLTRFLSIDEASNITRLVLKRLLTSTVVHICMPFTFIKGTIWVSLKALALLIVVNPCTLIHGSIFFNHGALSMTQAHFPLAEVVRLFGEAQVSQPILLLLEHLTYIDSTILRFHCWKSSFGWL